MKNPPVVFARQANINNGGQQQVNNGTQATGAGSPAPAPASNSATEPNKLLEATHGERMDLIDRRPAPPGRGADLRLGSFDAGQSVHGEIKMLMAWPRTRQSRMQAG